mmetsp:Transcript_36678/g.88375  ORF Transcript_36678/g.88375 Transcript_36678/m.88375 type:complete len:626 (-) Transcript_36678:59-1936(-)|eukprot:CAMPEP_0181107450 /NCGR_PEP_ID=MMETSP1071-20121207/17094_1 /TAXON_ID=35127 /ORGANISM="Thalassiosira sp., Strain NH16" /LENGTH=625 /DNA_ID=CAMNT_0023190969 /DNA_START=197 /DNA_END=2074 /DNA_ORIENTATION=-
MCQSQSSNGDKGGKVNTSSSYLGDGGSNSNGATPTKAADANDSSSNNKASVGSDSPSSESASPSMQLRRRRKRDRQKAWSKQLSTISDATTLSTQSTTHKRIIKKKKKSKMASKHGEDSKSGGMDSLIPSAIGVVILVFVVMARMGFRGRATVAGIDLGTTNSVVCVQAPSKGVGEIVCIPDPATNSPVVPSVVSFLDNHHLRSFRLSKEEKERTWPELVPHPVDAVVGQAAKERINSHPHHTLYHAKRIIGRDYNHESVGSLNGEVDFDIVSKGDSTMAMFSFPYHLPASSDAEAGASATKALLSPSEVGSYIIHHLRTLTRNHLQHDNVQSAVIAIPAKFEPSQRDATIRAFEMAGLKVARILEEPTAAALAYGLHKRDDVHYVMVYDFGGGTLDISLLYIGEGGYIDVLGSDGDEQLGGADFDAAVAHWLLEKKGGEQIVNDVMASLARIEEGMLNTGSDVMDVEDLIEELCPKFKDTPLCTTSSYHTIGERMKIGLSDHPDEPGAVAEETCYRLPSIDRENLPSTADELCEASVLVSMSLTLEEYDLAVENLYRRSLLPIRRLLKDLNLKKEEIDEVVMVGGTTRMPQIRELVRHELEKERLNTHIDPDLTVAYGAASVID